MGFITQALSGLWWLAVLAARGARAVINLLRRAWPSGNLWPILILIILAGLRWWALGAQLLAVLGVCALIWAVVIGYLGHKLTRPIEWVYAAICLGGVSLEVILTSVIGTPSWLNVAAVLGWAGLSLPWWLRGGNPVQKITPSETDLVRNWNTYIRDQHGTLAGASISLPTGFPHGNEYVVSVVPGKQHLGTFEGSIRNISTALNVPLSRLLIEQHPDHPDLSRLLRFRHVTKSPIEKPVFFTGPTVKDGRIVLGPYADGMGHASWRIFTDNSMWGGLLIGDVGSGKTRLLELIGLVARSMGVFLIYLDGQSGASSPTLWEHADWHGGPTEASTILDALERGKNKRQVYNRVHGLSGFTPGPELTGILVIIDECHRIFDPETAHRWADLAREIRKIGAALLGASHFSGLATFGGSDVLRSSLLAGNAVALRTSSRISAQLIPGLDVDPALFPADMPGYGYYVDASGTLRTAPFRCEWLPDERDSEKYPEIPVPTVEEWYKRTPRVELDELTASAFGPGYLHRHEIAEKQAAADRAWLEGREEEVPDFASPLEAMAYLVESGVIGTGPDADINAEPATVDELTQALHVDVKEALEEILTEERMPMKDIVEALAQSGRYPTVFTIFTVLQRLVADRRVEHDGQTYYRRAA